MGHSHERVVFKCGHVAHQCRCMESKPETTLPYPCHSCAGINTAAPSTVDRDALLEIALRHLGHTVKRCLWGGADRDRCSCASCCAWRWSLDDSALAAWRREMGK